MPYTVNWNLDFGKKKYRAGATLKDSDVPTNQVDVLLKCGVITALAPPAQEKATPADDSSAQSGQQLPADELAKLSKAMLAEYAKEQYGLALDPADMTKDAMLASIAETAAKAGVQK